LQRKICKTCGVARTPPEDPVNRVYETEEIKIQECGGKKKEKKSWTKVTYGWGGGRCNGGERRGLIKKSPRGKQ